MRCHSRTTRRTARNYVYLQTQGLKHLSITPKTTLSSTWNACSQWVNSESFCRHRATEQAASMECLVFQAMICGPTRSSALETAAGHRSGSQSTDGLRAGFQPESDTSILRCIGPVSKLSLQSFFLVHRAANKLLPRRIHFLAIYFPDSSFFHLIHSFIYHRHEFILSL